MATFTLDDIRAAAEAKYGSTDIDTGERTVSLLNPLRLGKLKRKRLNEIQQQLSEDDADQEALLADALRVVAATEGQARHLLDELGDDLALLVATFERYSEGTQAPEA